MEINSKNKMKKQEANNKYITIHCQQKLATLTIRAVEDYNPINKRLDIN